MESSNSEWKHLKRRQNFDTDDIELETEDISTTSDGSHKKAKYSWQIKRSNINPEHQSGEMPEQHNLSSHGTNFAVQSSRIGPEYDIEPHVLHLHGATVEPVQMEESGTEDDESIQNDSRYYEDQSIDLSADSHNTVASSSQESESKHHSHVPYRRHSVPILCRVPNSQQDNHERVSRNSDLTVWQSKHVAKSIVDNAINKTLEEMGVSPEKEQDEFMADKSELESQGISEAIKSQGLVHPSHQNESRTQLSPLLSHLRSASDLVFSQPGSQNLRHHETSQQNILQRTSDCPRVQSSRSSELTIARTTHVSYNEPDHNDHQLPSTSNATLPENVPVSNSEILDHAVSLVISNQGLSLP